MKARLNLCTANDEDVCLRCLPVRVTRWRSALWEVHSAAALPLILEGSDDRNRKWQKKKEAMPDEAEYEEDYVCGYFLNH